MSRRAPLAALVLSAWAGGLWIICGVVVPGLFWLIADTRVAGNVAAQFFYAETVLATVLGVSYRALVNHQLERNSRRWWWAAITAPLLFILVLRPLMNAARATGDLARFGQLHGLASTLFLIACLAVGVLNWRAATRRAG